MKKSTILFSLALALVILPACTNDEVQTEKNKEQEKEKESEEIMYTNKLPNTMNPKLKMFLRNHNTYSDSVIQLGDGKTIYAETCHTDSDRESCPGYYTISEENIDRLYDELKNAESKTDAFSDMPKKAEQFYKTVDPRQWKLPSIEPGGKNLLKLSVGDKEQTIDLSNFGEKTSSEHLRITLLNATEKDFFIEIYNWKEKRDFLLLAKRDLTKITIADESDKELSTAYKDGKLLSYKSLFQEIGSSGKYELFLRIRGGIIFDKEKKAVVHIREGDVLSKEGKQVYVAGNKLKAGEQEIYDLESYLDGKMTPEKTFTIDEKAIAKAAGLNKRAKLHFAKTVYMQEDFVVLYMTYKNYIADAGSVNVLVDLSGEKAKMDIVDLGLQSGMGF